MLEHWLRYQTYHLDYYLDDSGSVILDKDGRKIGVLYGLEYAHDWAVVQTTDDKTVNITMPIPRRDTLWSEPWDLFEP